MTRLLGGLCILIIGCFQNVLAGEASYNCQIAEQLSLGNNGNLEKPPRPYLIGQKFSVDRKTGATAGAELALYSLADSQIKILASGNSENAFSEIIVSPAAGGGVHTTSIWINEHSKTNDKPFVILANSQVTSGTCQ